MINLKQYNFYKVFLLFLLPMQFCIAQDVVKKDTSFVEVNYFKEQIKERYNGTDFNYSINDTGGVNLIQRILRKFFGWIRDIFGVDIDFVDYKTLEYIVYGLLGLGALYLFIKFLLQSPITNVFRDEVKTIDDFKYVEENLQQINFEKLISKALKDKNYRLATRYLFLKSLKTLTNKNVIDWHFDKTNNEYISEIKDSKTKHLFKRVSYIYDYVWYGEFPIDEDIFKKNKHDFNQLSKSVKNG